MKRPASLRTDALRSDLKRLEILAYHRLEHSKGLVQKFHRFRRSDRPDVDHLEKLYDWLFVPITLWPIDIEGLFRAALDRVGAGKRLDKTMILLIDLLPALPSNRTQRAVSEHEHSVQRGNYESLIRARHKYVESAHRRTTAPPNSGEIAGRNLNQAPTATAMLYVNHV